MGLTIRGYRVFNDAGEKIALLCPSWDSVETVRNLYGKKTLSEIIQAYPDFPLEATWFTLTTEQKQNALNAGLPNVWSIREIVASGNKKWYFNESKTKYIEFFDVVGQGHIDIHIGASYIATGAWVDSENVVNDNNRRLRTMFSDTLLDGSYRNEFYNTPTSDGKLYFYYTGINYPEPFNSLNTQFITDFWDGIEPYIEPLDPYEAGGGASTTGGGTGTFSETGDIVGIPGLPTLSAVDTGFITLFNPTAAQVKQLASYMWSNSFDLATFKNIVANPIDCILGLTIVPVDPPNAGSKAVSVGNIPTDVSMPYLSTQYVEVDCGTLNVQEFWGSYLDYSPYTKMSLYLPYIGIVPLDIDDVMNASITIKYHVDVLSGACVAYVLCNGTQLYTYIGQCSSNVPVTSNDFTNTVNGILGIAGSIGSLVATDGATAPTEIGNMAGNAINALKPNVQKSGAMSGTGGLMGVQTPYLICQRPRQSVPASQNTFTGYPSNITATLSDLSGYTEVEKIHLEGVPCTNEEMTEIMTLLESGVYI